MHRQLTRYLEREITLDEFAEWFVPEALRLDEQAQQHPEAATFAAHVDLLLIEFSDGYWTEDEFRAHLAQLLAEATRIPSL